MLSSLQHNAKPAQMLVHSSWLMNADEQPTGATDMQLTHAQNQRRLARERTIIRAYLTALLNAGFELRVNDGMELFPVSKSLKTLVEQITAVDEATVVVTHPQEGQPRRSFLFFVLGNEPEEVLCDYGTNLDQWIEPVSARYPL